MIKNSKGKVWYGMHFYPGVAEYSEPGTEPYRVFLNEDTIRAMDPTFAARPIFVEHVDSVDQDLNEVRKDADGWVVESFFNAADGKHWVKFLTVSDRADNAIRAGMRLSNAYVPKSYGPAGMWNGVAYSKEITGGEYEHLAIVKHPRYEESVIMSPEQFKAYNEQQQSELKRLANSKNKGDNEMKLNFFKRTKVDNAADLEGMSVLLPKSGKERTIAQIVNDMDMAMSDDAMANGDHHVMVGEEKMKVNDLVKKHMDMCNEMAAMKKNKVESESDVTTDKEGVDVESDMQNDEDEEAKKKALQLAEHEEKEIEEAKKKNALEAAALKKREEAKRKAEVLRNAEKQALINASQSTAKVEISMDQVARGQARYGTK